MKPIARLLLTASMALASTLAAQQTQLRPATNAELAALKSEPCEPRASVRPVPRYTAEMSKSGVGGRVIVRVASNRCGEVRFAWVEKSSRSAMLDSLALESFAGAVFERPAEGLGASDANGDFPVESWVPIDFAVPGTDDCPEFKLVSGFRYAGYNAVLRDSLLPDKQFPVVAESHERGYRFDTKAKPVFLVEFGENSAAPGAFLIGRHTESEDGSNWMQGPLELVFRCDADRSACRELQRQIDSWNGRWPDQGCQAWLPN